MSWLVLALCLVLSFIFSGIEAGIFSVSRLRLAHRAKQRDRAALKLTRLLEQPDRLLITVLVVTNLANIFALVIATGHLVAACGQRGYWIALAIYPPFYLFFLELLPKSLLRRCPYRALSWLAELLRLADLLLSPMHMVGGFLLRALFGGRPVQQQRLFLGREDFRYFAAQGEKSGALGKGESELINNVVDFRGILAKDVMLPLNPERTLGADATVRELLARSEVRRFDRWLVVGASGAVTGVVSAFEVLLEGRRDVTVGVYQRRIVAVEPGETAYNVLRKLRAARGTVAIVRGSGVEPLGVLTWEDLIRKLVTVAAK